MDHEARHRFVAENCVCVYGYPRKSEGPAMTLGYYALDGNYLCYITMASRAKAKAALRDHRASMCILDMKRPPSYLQVYGTVTVETDLDYVVDIFRQILRKEMVNEGNAASVDGAGTSGDDLRTWCREEERVVLRLTPHSTFYSPPTRGRDATEKLEYRRTLGDIQEGSLRVGTMLPW